MKTTTCDIIKNALIFVFYPTLLCIGAALYFDAFPPFLIILLTWLVFALIIWVGSTFPLGSKPVYTDPSHTHDTVSPTFVDEDADSVKAAIEASQKTE